MFATPSDDYLDEQEEEQKWWDNMSPEERALHEQHIVNDYAGFMEHIKEEKEQNK